MREAEAPFIELSSCTQIKRAECQYKKRKFVDGQLEVPSFYLDDENNPLTLSQVFADPDKTKQIFGGGTTGNLTHKSAR